MLHGNDWITGGIDNIFKIPRTNILKICLKETATAKLATEKGLLAFHMSIPYIIGDLNAHHPTIDRRRSNNVGKAIQILIDHNKLIHIGPDFPTYISYNSTSTPDIILTNNKTYHNINITQGPTTPFDHLPILINLTAQSIHTPTIPTYVAKKANWEKFKEHIEQTNSTIDTNQYSKASLSDTSLTDISTFRRP